MTQLVDGYFRFLKGMVAVCLALMVILVLGNVILRYAFNSGITVSEELSRWLFVWLVFTGAIVAMREHSHLGMEMVVSKLPVIGKKICYVLSHILMIGCVILFMTGSWDQTLINIGVEAPATGLSSGFFYGVGLFFSAPALCILSYDLFKMLSGKLADKDLIQIKETEDELDEEELAELQREMEHGLEEKQSLSDSAKD